MEREPLSMKMLQCALPCVRMVVECEVEGSEKARATIVVANEVNDLVCGTGAAHEEIDTINLRLFW